ncbi:protein archease isoform X1 [Cloeon dipterum]|uniref:protein archease isoform X1 n=1 Tax=Cloeon dipterum TaxID=197152 RepID=UPI00321FCAC7
MEDHEIDGELGPFAPEVYDIPWKQYEYLDHTADVQLHSWGDTVEECFEQCAVAMFDYISELDKCDILEMRRVSVEGHDMLSLLYNFLDECLFMFNCEPFFLAKKVKIIEFDRTAWKIRAELYGEEFDLEKHPQGTEVKAITYSNMQVHEDKPQKEVFVIIDI